MAVSIVLRLVPSALAEGRIAGEAELVETGRRAVIRDADELVAFALVGAGPVEGRDPGATAPVEDGR